MLHKSCRSRTIEKTPMKSVYCEVKRLPRDRDMHKIHIGVFHYDTTGDCKHQQKKKPLVPYDYRILAQEWGARANELNWMVDNNTLLLVYYNKRLSEIK